jgi:DNA-directed RNA polymerase sigma subunit (sigma70/sigma32)
MNPSRLKHYLLCVQRLEPLDVGETRAALLAWQDGDERGRRLLEERHLRRVVAWVQPYRGQGMGLAELIETGNRALLRSLRRVPALRAVELEDHLRTAVEESVEALLLARRP